MMIFQIFAKIDNFFKFWQKMMIFQLAAKIEDFSNFFKKNFYFFYLAKIEDFLFLAKMMIFSILAKNDDFSKFWPKFEKIIHFGQIEKIYSMEVGVVLVSCQCRDTGMTLVSFWCCQHYRNIGPSSPATHSVSMTE